VECGERDDVRSRRNWARREEMGGTRWTGEVVGWGQGRNEAGKERVWQKKGKI